MKLEPFDALDPESWRNFRARCDVALRRNGWGQQVAKEMIFGAVTGKAASRISHVRLGSDPEQVPPLPDAPAPPRRSPSPIWRRIRCSR